MACQAVIVVEPGSQVIEGRFVVPEPETIENDWEAPGEFVLQRGESLGPHTFDELEAKGAGTHLITL